MSPKRLPDLTDREQFPLAQTEPCRHGHYSVLIYVFEESPNEVCVVQREADLNTN
jgi:hypothetical protein